MASASKRPRASNLTANEVLERILEEGEEHQGRSIIGDVEITEGDSITLNCNTDYNWQTWSRRDGTPVENERRVLIEKSKLRITDAAISDAGEYVCDNGPVKHIFTLLIKVLVKVEMVVRVLNYEYTPELQNKSSPVYKETERNFTTEMDKVYINNPNYNRTEVLNFTKGSVKVDFRVIIVIVATDPKNASSITDRKAETAHTVVLEAKSGFVKQLKVDPVVEVKTPPLEPMQIEVFDIKSDELSVRWKPSEDAESFKVEYYKVQHKKFEAEQFTTKDLRAVEGRDENQYSYRIQELEPETTYLIRVGAVNDYGGNYNEEQAHTTDAAPFAEWIIVLIVLGVVLVIAITIGVIICVRSKAAEERRRREEEEMDARFGGLVGSVRLDSLSHYEDKNVKGLKYSYINDSFKPSEVHWDEIPYENIRLLEELGSGAFGVVYKGELTQSKGDSTPCAVKALKASATNEEIRDLYNELEIMTNVGHHPNLVNLLGACTEDGHLLVVLEIAENGSLLDFLKKSRGTDQNYSSGLSEEMKLRIATDVAKGMAHLASCRCIHRDLAARNILLGENYVAKVADYGMARDVYEELMYKKETQGKLPVKWMAIESLETYVFTMESDVWSFGVLLWEVESGGMRPYAGMNTTELMTALKRGYRLEKPRGCSDEMYQVMRDCWDPNPRARPTFDQLVARLESMAVPS